MRVLLTSHLFPPAHQAGTEVYTAELGERLVQRGHDVAVFTTDKDIGRADLSLRERSFRRLRVFELTNSLLYESFEQTWRHPAIEAHFARVLDELSPDVVHVQHLMYLSLGCLDEVHRRGIPIVYTLHDFWLACPRMGQLVHADGELCRDVDFERCGTCLPSFAWRQGEFERRSAQAIARFRAATGVDLGPLARGARRTLLARRKGNGDEPAELPAETREHWTRLAAQRSDDVRARVVQNVDRFVSPSRFLRDWFTRWGIPAERIEHVATGVDASFRERRVERQPSEDGRLRIAFLGTLVPLKGAHVLLEAWERLTDAERAAASLTFFGPGHHAPAYVADLEQRARRSGARCAGALDHERVASELARTDVLVVPSVWFENRPLVLLEAFATRTPLLVSDLGGMAELVQDGVQGWRFPAGDADALARRLRALLAEPQALRDLYPREVELPTWDELCERTLELYAGLVAQREAR